MSLVKSRVAIQILVFDLNKTTIKHATKVSSTTPFKFLIFLRDNICTTCLYVYINSKKLVKRLYNEMFLLYIREQMLKTNNI